MRTVDSSAMMLVFNKCTFQLQGKTYYRILLVKDFVVHLMSSVLFFSKSTMTDMWLQRVVCRSKAFFYFTVLLEVT